MRRCALLTIEDLSGHVFDDDLLLPPLEEAGWQVESVPWTAPEDWSRFDCAVVRTTWDYHKQPDRFIDVLEQIDSQTRLFNAYELVRWNVDKVYLRDLADRGVPVVPTRFGQGLDAEKLATLRLDLGGKPDAEIVVKPPISASADDTFRLRPGDEEADRAVLDCFAERRYMAQPFIRSVVEEGELSVFYFAGELSHSVLKSPKADDFRVQEEHGGRLRRVEPEPAALELGRKTLEALEFMPLVARVDMVRSDGISGDGSAGGFALMELELIEPSLYLSYAPGAATRFADALSARFA